MCEEPPARAAALSCHYPLETAAEIEPRCCHFIGGSTGKFLASGPDLAVGPSNRIVWDCHRSIMPSLKLYASVAPKTTISTQLSVGEAALARKNSREASRSRHKVEGLVKG